MDLALLGNMSIILITAVIVLLVFNKLKLPTMIGLFFTGIVLGHAINDTSLISTVSELGVIFLLFIIGLEFSVEKFSSIKRYALIGGFLQVSITTILISALGLILGLNPNSALFFGFLVAFSSTAIVMKIMQQRHITHSVQGRVTLGILIFQDIAVIIVILITPLLGGHELAFNNLPSLIVKCIGLVVMLYVGAKWFIPLALRDAAKTKNRDLFLLLTLFICMGTTFGTSLIGIGPELGAFIAGLLISNTEYSHQTLGYIQPFQDVKFTATLITGMALKLPSKVTISIAVLLSQIGEFSFVLAREGMNYGLMTNQFFSVFLGVSILTMSATPFLEKMTPKIVRLFNNIDYFDIDEELMTLPEEIEDPQDISDHVILVGLGRNGKHMARACKKFNIPYRIVDMNPVIVENQQAMGLPVIYGKGSNESVLKELGITSALCIVISSSTYDETIKTIDAARRLNPDIHIIVRTRYLKNLDDVIEAGADEVIPKEFETSIMMFTRIMDYYNKDVDEITDAVNDLRSNNYDAFRSVTSEDISTYLNHKYTNLEVDSLRVSKDQSIDDFPFTENSLTITGVIRGKDTFIDVTPHFKLLANDLIVFVGHRENINKFFDAI